MDGDDQDFFREVGARRADHRTGILAATTVACGLGTAALGVFEAKPRYLVPVGGMVIGNAMTAAAVALP